MGSTAVRDAGLIAAPEGSPTRTPWLAVWIDSDLGDDVETVWLGGLMHGAVADMMRTNEATTAAVVGGAQIAVTDSTGVERAVPLGVGSASGGQVFNSPTDEELRARAQAVANQYGLELLSATVVHPLETALWLKFELAENARIDWTIDRLRAAVTGTPTSLEGVLIEVYSPAGEPLLRTGSAFRVGGGGLWFAPGQDERFSALHGGLAGGQSPGRTTN